MNGRHRAHELESIEPESDKIRNPTWKATYTCGDYGIATERNHALLLLHRHLLRPSLTMMQVVLAEGA